MERYFIKLDGVVRRVSNTFISNGELDVFLTETDVYENKT